MVGWWRGEQNANDQLGLNNGILQNGATFAPGEVGAAFVASVRRSSASQTPFRSICQTTVL
jgi:hypothetical protein